MGNQDANMQTFLAENLMDEEIWFENVHSRNWRQPMQWLKITCPPGMLVQLPHSYYKVFSKSGKPVQMKKHYGIEKDKRLHSEKSRVLFTPQDVKF